MRHALSPLWLLAEQAEMDGLIKRKVWLAVKRSSLKPHHSRSSERSWRGIDFREEE